jgi:hypothetical protein
MTERVRILKEQAAEFQRLAALPDNSPGLAERLLQLAAQCERLAASIERNLQTEARPH